MDRNIDFSNASTLNRLYSQNVLEYYDMEEIRSLYPEIFRLFTVTNVKKVNNPQLWGMYLLHKEELSKLGLVNEMILYHVTSSTCAEHIARDNIDWRRTTRTRFGMGACFSPSPKYAHDKSSLDGALIICKVLVQNTESTLVNYNLEIPVNQKNDTTKDYKGNVYVKYDDYSFYPEFIVYYNYTSKERSRKRGFYF